MIGHQDGLAIVYRGAHLAAPLREPVRPLGRPQTPTRQRRGSNEQPLGTDPVRAGAPAGHQERPQTPQRRRKNTAEMKEEV